MELTLALLHLAGYVAGALATVVAGLRRWAVFLLAAGAALALALALAEPGPRQLECTHTYVGYEGIALEPGPVYFKTATATADGWLWPLPFVAFAVFWIAMLLARRPAPDQPRPYLWPLLFGWTASAAWIGMQALAAPAAVVQPFGLERLLWPAGLALTLALAGAGTAQLPVLLQLCVGIVALRLPAALFSKYASDHRLGTGLDISGVVDIVNPTTRLQFDPPLLSGSPAQQFWLIWAEHVLFYPAFHFLGFAGIAFAIGMMRKHAATAP